MFPSPCYTFIRPRSRAGKPVSCCPGGGFRGVAVEHEGRAFASWFNERGITLAVLKYRLPNGRREIPGEDIRRAVRLLEERSRRLAHPVSGGRWGPPSEAMSRRCGGPVPGDGNATGFSNPALSGYQYAGRADASSSRERLMGPHPSGDEIAACALQTGMFSTETPAAFIALAGRQTRPLRPENSLLYYRALMDNRVPASLHIYPKGGHGFGFSDTFPL